MPQKTCGIIKEMPSRNKKQHTKKKVSLLGNKIIDTRKLVRNTSRSAESQILLRKELITDGNPNLDSIPQSVLNLLAMGMSSVAFKLSFESGSIILKRSRIRDPESELGSPDTPLHRELAFYKFIDGLPVLEQQFMAKCYDWRVYDKCLYSGMGLLAADPFKPSVEAGVCLDMLLEYKGPSLADWLNARYLHTKSGMKSVKKTTYKSGKNSDALTKLGAQLGGGKRYPPKEPYRVLYSIFWQLAVIFKSLGKKGWYHVDAHPHNITVVNGLTLASGARIDYSPMKVEVPTDLVPTEIRTRLAQLLAPNIIPISYQLPTQGIQIALIDYNLVRHAEFPKAELGFAGYGTKIVGEEGIAAMNLELKRRVLALVFGEHKMMAELRRRNAPLLQIRLMRMANNMMAEKYPEEWQDMVSRLSNDPDRILLGYPDYLSSIRNNQTRFKMLYNRIEKEIFWLWQINHAAEICGLHGFDTVYQPLLPKARVMELFFGAETRTPDNIIIWCCERLGVRLPFNSMMGNKRLEQTQKNEAE
jgi:hypothetical protein